MAIDTTEKRYSLLNFGDGSTIHLLPEADATLDKGDRQHLLDCYSGIPFGIPTLVVALPGRVPITTGPLKGRVGESTDIRSKYLYSPDVIYPSSANYSLTFTRLSPSPASVQIHDPALEDTIYTLAYVPVVSGRHTFRTTATLVTDIGTYEIYSDIVVLDVDRAPPPPPRIFLESRSRSR